jgi:hypothetical protein
MVDLIPACTNTILPPFQFFDSSLAVRHVPTWFPFTGWRRKANTWAATLNQLVEQPYSFVKHQMVRPLPSVGIAAKFFEHKVIPYYAGCGHGTYLVHLHPS